MQIDTSKFTAVETARAKAADEKAERAELIGNIRSAWMRAAGPGEYLEDALMSRFGKNQITMLDTDMLRRVLAAIA